MSAGRIGLIMCAISQSGALRLTLTSDQIICDEKTNQRILKMVYDNVISEIERTKEMPMPEDKKTK